MKTSELTFSCPFGRAILSPVHTAALRYTTNSTQADKNGKNCGFSSFPPPYQQRIELKHIHLMDCNIHLFLSLSSTIWLRL
ncbi:hypothetical protein GDO86_002298 [Hymenochirus boettgeri]|uniref:Uncharacterized protein n=1 Tax=Hymenochirus boettgeri TaxID=247094 RepID=A0A8T2KHD6_9PIPI|nr:hypothetical protein GDO86_002298 [Hymenochirus boettgeri]